MKMFVSGQIGDVEKVRLGQEALRRAGHEITHDWTRNGTGSAMLGGREAKFAQPEESARRASNDMQGVIDSDIFHPAIEVRGSVEEIVEELSGG